MAKRRRRCYPWTYACPLPTGPLVKIRLALQVSIFILNFILLRGFETLERKRHLLVFREARQDTQNGSHNALNLQFGLFRVSDEPSSSGLEAPWTAVEEG